MQTYRLITAIICFVFILSNKVHASSAIDTYRINYLAYVKGKNTFGEDIDKTKQFQSPQIGSLLPINKVVKIVPDNLLWQYGLSIIKNSKNERTYSVIADIKNDFIDKSTINKLFKNCNVELLLSCNSKDKTCEVFRDSFTCNYLNDEIEHDFLNIIKRIGANITFADVNRFNIIKGDYKNKTLLAISLPSVQCGTENSSDLRCGSPDELKTFKDSSVQYLYIANKLISFLPNAIYYYDGKLINNTDVVKKDIAREISNAQSIIDKSDKQEHDHILSNAMRNIYLANYSYHELENDELNFNFLSSRRFRISNYAKEASLDPNNIFQYKALEFYINVLSGNFKEANDMLVDKNLIVIMAGSETPKNDSYNPIGTQRNVYYRIAQFNDFNEKLAYSDRPAPPRYAEKGYDSRKKLTRKFNEALRNFLAQSTYLSGSGK